MKKIITILFFSIIGLFLWAGSVSATIVFCSSPICNHGVTLYSTSCGIWGTNCGNTGACCHRAWAVDSCISLNERFETRKIEDATWAAGWGCYPPTPTWIHFQNHGFGLMGNCHNFCSCSPRNCCMTDAVGNSFVLRNVSPLGSGWSCDGGTRDAQNCRSSDRTFCPCGCHNGVCIPCRPTPDQIIFPITVFDPLPVPPIPPLPFPITVFDPIPLPPIPPLDFSLTVFDPLSSILSLPFPLTVFDDLPSAINLSVTQGDYCGAASPPIFLNWQFSDPNPGHTQSAYRVQIDNNSDFGSVEIDSCVPSPGTCAPGNTSLVYAPPGLSFNTTYHWRVMVWNNHNMASAWSVGPSFTTARHRHPVPNFTWAPPSPTANTPIQFTDTSVCFGINNTRTPCASWSWAFGDGATSTLQNPTHSYAQNIAHTVTLRITDGSGHTCSISQVLNVGLPLPEWREIAPIGWLRKLFADAVGIANIF